MRTNIDLDDQLLADTMELSGKRTKKAAVEEAMRRYIRGMRMQRFIAETAGIGWDGDLEEMRSDLDATVWSLEPKP
jgi:Arc/MetJ family transcription regulator